jgi:hypothetical protein
VLKNRLLATAAWLVLIISGRSQAATSTPSTPTGQSTAPAMNLPNNTPVVGKPLTNLDVEQAKVGYAADVQASEDVKSDHDVLIKKGSILNGQITSVQLFCAGSRCEIGILFDVSLPRRASQPLLALAFEP